jgi:hypothetical protein
MRPASLSAAYPPQCGEAFLQLAVAAHRLVSRALVDHLGHQNLLLLQVGQQAVEAAGGQHPVAGEHVEVALAGILGQVPDVAAANHGSGEGLTLTGQDPHGGGLACAVASDEADAVAGLDAQRRTFGEQQRARPGADLEVRCGNHWRCSSSSLRSASSPARITGAAPVVTCRR